MPAAGSDGRGVRHLAALRGFARSLRGAEAARCSGPLPPASVLRVPPGAAPAARRSAGKVGALRGGLSVLRRGKSCGVSLGHSGPSARSRREAQGLRSGGARFAGLMVARLFLRRALQTDILRDKAGLRPKSRWAGVYVQSGGLNRAGTPRFPLRFGARRGRRRCAQQRTEGRARERSEGTSPPSELIIF